MTSADREKEDLKSPVVKARYQRKVDRNNKVDAARSLLDMSNAFEPPEEMESESYMGTAAQTDVDQPLFEAMQSELQTLRTENVELREQISSVSAKYKVSDFEGNNEKTKYYTGLPTFVLLWTLYSFLEPYLPVKKTMDKFQLLIMTLMRLRLNLSLQLLSFEFNVHQSTISRYLSETITIMFVRMMLIVWPEREPLRKTMPMQFRKHFGTRVSVIIDCFEVFMERPSNLLARAKTWSSYKHHHTAKFLIGITPQDDDAKKKTFLDTILVPAVAAMGPVVVANAVARRMGPAVMKRACAVAVAVDIGVNVFSSVFGAYKRNKELKRMTDAYESTEKSVERVAGEKREVLAKKQELRKDALERCVNIRKMTQERAGLGDVVQNLMEASARLGEVDRQLIRIIRLWENIVAKLKFLQADTKAGEVYLKKIKNLKLREEFKLSIARAEKWWKRFGRICSDFVISCERDEELSIQVLYKFLSDSIDSMPADRRATRMEEIKYEIVGMEEIEDEIIYKRDEK